MVKLSKDVPKFIIEMLQDVDYTRITEAHYDDWMRIIKENIGKHLRLKSKQSALVEYYFPIRQDFCDLINRYDFSSLSFKKQMVIIPLAKKWAMENLPLKTKL